MTRRAPGSGTVYRPTYTATNGSPKTQRVWWIGYQPLGQPYIRESAHTNSRSRAEEILRERLREAATGAPMGPDVEVATVSSLIPLLRDDYKANRRRSWKRAALSARHLEKHLGQAKVKAMSEATLSSYVARRLQAKAAAATVNRELAALRRMLHLGQRSGLVAKLPAFAMLQEDNARQGFFDAGQLRAVLRHLPAAVQPVIETAYETGWRVYSEILTRQWRHVDFRAGWLRLEPGETKNRRGRMFPLTPRLRRVLKAQRARTTRLRGRIIPWVFHREGEPIRVFRKDWQAACRGAGLPGKLVHDFRRTAVRNLIRAGVSQPVAMSMVGMETPSIFRRYAIVDETMLKEAGEKYGHLEATLKSDRLNRHK